MSIEPKIIRWNAQPLVNIIDIFDEILLVFYTCHVMCWMEITVVALCTYKHENELNFLKNTLMRMPGALCVLLFFVLFFRGSFD